MIQQNLKNESRHEVFHMIQTMFSEMETLHSVCAIDTAGASHVNDRVDPFFFLFMCIPLVFIKSYRRVF